jgi:threonine dehydrogenase-like Zn-dependent dehydrogenase
MKAAIFGGPRNITVGDRPDPVIQDPTDAIVRVTLACVCGSDLWYYRGLSPHDLGAIGHEFVGVVEEAGAEVRDLQQGDFVLTPFTCAGPAGRRTVSMAAATATTGWTVVRVRRFASRSQMRPS